MCGKLGIGSGLVCFELDQNRFMVVEEENVEVAIYVLCYTNGPQFLFMVWWCYIIRDHACLVACQRGLFHGFAFVKDRFSNQFPLLI